MRKHFIYIVFIITCVALVYGNAIDNGFVHDDAHFIVNNKYIKDLSLWKLYFTDEYTISPEGHDIYRPFRTLSFAFDYYMFRLNSSGFHLVNILFHMLNSVFVYLLSFQLFACGDLKRRYDTAILSLLTSLLFALHPVQSETVAWVSCRGDLLFAFSALSGTFFYILSREKKYDIRKRYFLFALSVFIFVCGLLSKETAIMFPFAMLAVEWYYGDGLFRWDRNRVKRYMPFAAIIFPYMITRLAVVGKLAQRPYYGGGIFDTVLTMVIAYGKYFRLLLLPYDLHVVYTVGIPKSFFEPHVLWAFLSILLIAISAVLFRKKRIFIFSLMWFFIYMLPTSNIVPFKGIMTEHFLYLPVLGFCMLIAMPVASLCAGPYRGAATAVAVSVLLIYSAITMARNRDWFSNYSLWTSELENAPVESFQAYTGIGIELGKAGRYEESIENLKKAIELEPTYNIPHYSISLSYAGLQPPNIELSKKHAVIAAFLGCRLNPGFIEYLKETEDAQIEQDK